MIGIARDLVRRWLLWERKRASPHHPGSQAIVRSRHSVDRAADGIRSDTRHPLADVVTNREDLVDGHAQCLCLHRLAPFVVIEVVVTSQVEPFIPHKHRERQKVMCLGRAAGS